MVWLRHKGCISPLVEYRGAAPLVAGTVMKQAEWFAADGNPAPRIPTCQDCGSRIHLSGRNFIACEPPASWRESAKSNEQIRRELGWDMIKSNGEIYER